MKIAGAPSLQQASQLRGSMCITFHLSHLMDKITWCNYVAFIYWESLLAPRLEPRTAYESTSTLNSNKSLSRQRIGKGGDKELENNLSSRHHHLGASSAQAIVVLRIDTTDGYFSGPSYTGILGQLMSTGARPFQQAPPIRDIRCGFV